MGKSAYLGSYELENQDESFTFTYEIPENCHSEVDNETVGSYTIVVTLNPNEKFPSPIFIVKTETVTCDENGDLEIGFILPESGGLGLAKKPKITVNSIVG